MITGLVEQLLMGWCGGFKGGQIAFIYIAARSQYYNSDLVCGVLRGFSIFIYVGAVSSTIKVVGK